MKSTDGRIAVLGSKVKDRTGMKIGTLTVLNEYECRDGNAWWKAKCECGVEKFYPINKVLSHFNKVGHYSCGCSREAQKVNEPNARKLYARYKGGALRRGYSFEISFEDFKEISQRDCEYCGTSPSRIGLRVRTRFDEELPNFVYNGIDRLDNTIGYLYDNCVPCCTICNTMKQCLTVEELKSHISKIYKHLQLDQ